ncbi:dihydropteroate synthase [Andreesenia angusta]|uniref:Dihydropteroate synthase n=1 Tax=Andreesenia angusta TaxID=39480 RepID=A0A1S1V6R0_9FIRM|nr:dihydropteroate synthase [Andreesenia angusta]OHW62090.1 dihydropteroate synthase [Andreesenia angusta]
MRNIGYRLNRKVNMKCRNTEFKFGERTYIMGILNVTPDSFSDGGKYFDEEDAVRRAKAMIAEGADILDIGAESTRPGYTVISDEEEIARLTPVVQRLLSEVEVPISIDTYKPAVAEAMLKLGVDIINDIWGLQRDPEMANVIAKYDASVVVMHNQDGTDYEKDMVETVCDFLRESIAIGLKAGIKPENIVLDPGIGFGKTPEQNAHMMARLGEINDLGYPILLGTSRKSMIGKILDLPAEERVEGTVATSVMGVVQGMDIVRVHDVKENARAIKVSDAIIRGVDSWIK